MTPLQKQSYNLWFNHIANLIMQWSKEKPANTDLKNIKTCKQKTSIVLIQRFGLKRKY